jgi:capsule polysaccharide export protein KpsE/RkpR
MRNNLQVKSYLFFLVFIMVVVVFAFFATFLYQKNVIFYANRDKNSQLISSGFSYSFMYFDSE